MKMTLNEVTKGRVNEHSYLIEDSNDEYFVIYGTRFTEISNGELYSVISSFLDENKYPSWEFVRKRLKHDRDEDAKDGKKSRWFSLDRKAGEKIVAITSLHVDGIKSI